MNIIILDYDETLIIGETPEGETLSKFYKRNTFFCSIFLSIKKHLINWNLQLYQQPFQLSLKLVHLNSR